MSSKILVESIEFNDGVDYFTDFHIGQGKAQKVLSIPLYLMLFSEGCESAVLGILLPQLQQEWNVDDSDKSLLITLVFVGIVIGSASNSYADNIGRYNVILAAAAILSIFGILSCLCTSFTQFVVIRFIYGIGMGISLPMAGTYLSEISTSSYRGVIISLFCVLWAIGTAGASILGWILLNGFHWRILFFIIALPSIAALYLHITNGKQSLRFLIAHQRYEEAHDLIVYCRKLNNMQHDQLEVTLHRVKQITTRQKQFVPWSQIISPKYRFLTFTLCSLWISMAFIYYAITLLLPTILQDFVSQNWKYAVITCISMIEIGSYFFATRMMDTPEIGRKKALMINIFIILCMSLVCGFIEQPIAFIAVFGLMKLCVQAFSMILFTYTAECYPTVLRAKAMGLVSMTGRIATVILGVAGIAALHSFNGYGLYIIFIVLSGTSLQLLRKAGKETLGQPMDQT